MAGVPEMGVRTSCTSSEVVPAAISKYRLSQGMRGFLGIVHGWVEGPLGKLVRTQRRLLARCVERRVEWPPRLQREGVLRLVAGAFLHRAGTRALPDIGDQRIRRVGPCENADVDAYGGVEATNAAAQ
eukprot:5563416-Prymnesium_polylepis.1